MLCQNPIPRMKGHVMAEVSVVPLSRTTRSVGDHVAKCPLIPKQAKDIPCQLTLITTTIEAPSKGVLNLAKKCSRGHLKWKDTEQPQS
ncbi:MAG: hypothetical protein E3J66_02630 [Dehalococcoidia bacterium]|nr:MAG: hypothetical protein E3J66_02630 [Dehalococcoidia bacterium]